MKSGLRIAVADDESMIRLHYQEILPLMGHEVVVAADNGRKLVEQCKTALPDLVISDIRMPEMDGIEAALAIYEQTPLPIILVSAFHDEDLIERAQTSNIMAYLIKPVGRSDLETAITIAHRRFQQIQSLQTESAELKQTLEDRKVIERAKGILMKVHRLGEEEAFRRMQRMACNRNRKLAEVARQIVRAGQ